MDFPIVMGEPAAKSFIEKYCVDTPCSSAVRRLANLDLNDLRLFPADSVPNGYVVIDKFELHKADGTSETFAYIMHQYHLDLMLYDDREDW